MSLTINSWAQPVFNNVYDYGQNLTDAAERIIENDNSFYVTGAHNYGFGNSASTIMKLDNTGQILFYENFDFSSRNDVLTACIFQNSKLYCMGSMIDTTENPNVGYNSYLLQIDPNTGDSLYFEEINFGYYDRAIDLLPYKNGFLLLGYIYNNVGIDYNYTFLSHIDTLGNVISYQEYGDGLGYHLAYDFNRTADGGVVIAGQTDDYPIESRNQIWIMKLDSNLNQSWYYEYGDTTVDQSIRTFNYLEVTEDNGFLLVSERDSLFFGTYTSSSLLKLDAQGNKLWEKELSLSESTYVMSTREWSDQSILVAGNVTNYTNPLMGFEDPRGYLSKYTTDGQTLIWQRYFSKWWGIPTNQDYVHDMILTSDGGILISGYQIHALVSNNDAWLVKFDSCGYTTNNPTEALLVVDSIVNATVYISNLSEEYCTGSYTINGQNGVLDNMDVYAYSEWTNGDNPNQLQYTFQDTGAYEITINIIGGDSTDSYTVQFNILDTVSSIKPSEAWENQIHIFPNPVKDYLVIQNDFSLNNSATNSLACTIYTTTGQAIKSFDLDPSLYQQRIFIDDISNGVYLLNFTADGLIVGNKRLSVVR